MKTDCYIVRDLLSLYVEDMVSEETAAYVKQHLKDCAECQLEFEGLKNQDEWDMIAAEEKLNGDHTESFKKIMKRVNRKLNSMAYAVIIIFTFLGFSLTGGSDLMYNSIIMPIVGVFGYYVFRWSALYKLPVLIVVINFLACRFNIVQFDIISVLPWSFIYCGLAFVGVLIAFLLHFAFRREYGKL